MRKSIVSVLAAGVALSLAACGGTGSPATSESAAPAAGSLTIWVDETRIDDFKALGEDFVSASGVALDVVQKPTADIKTDFVAQAPTGEGPDLIVGAHDWTGELVSNGLISPIELGDKGKLPTTPSPPSSTTAPCTASPTRSRTSRWSATTRSSRTPRTRSTP